VLLAEESATSHPLDQLCNPKLAVADIYWELETGNTPLRHKPLHWQSLSHHPDVCNDKGGVPHPLVLPHDFDELQFTRGYTLVQDSRAADRHRAAAVAARRSDEANGDPLERSLLEMARAQIYAFSGHEDLWHMDWRARLVPMAAQLENDTGTPILQTDVVMIAAALDRLYASDGYRVFEDRFLRH